MPAWISARAVGGMFISNAIHISGVITIANNLYENSKLALSTVRLHT
jgi:hypothetical protein